MSSKRSMTMSPTLVCNVALLIRFLSIVGAVVASPRLHPNSVVWNSQGGSVGAARPRATPIGGTVKKKKQKELQKAAAAAAASAASTSTDVLGDGLTRATEILGDASRRAAALIDEAQKRAVPAAKDAGARAADFAAKRLDSWEPHIKG